MAIMAITIDSREPDWVKNLKFGGAAIAVAPLPTGDAMIWLDDGQVLMIERKASDDFLGSIKDGRLFAQAVRLTEDRLAEQLNGQSITTWPYVMITGMLRPSGKNLAITDRGETEWNWDSVNGAILTLQELGVFVSFARDDGDYERAVMALSNRARGDVKVFPARSFELVSQQAAFLMGLPGIGEERSAQVLHWADGNLSHALIGLVDPQIKTPVGKAVQSGIRRFLGLAENNTIELKEV
jgi:ERCC4-type nuclease